MFKNDNAGLCDWLLFRKRTYIANLLEHPNSLIDNSVAYPKYNVVSPHSVHHSSLRS
jgi:hypothetical protein